VSASAETAPRAPRARGADRLAAVFVLVTLGLATLFFWIGIPIGGLWLLSQLTESWNGHFLMSVVLIPTAMALFAPALIWLNGLYLRVVGAWSATDEERLGRQGRLRGPLETFLYLGLAVAVVALCVWFFFYAKYPPEVVW
jgi:uncharacterized membrane protein YidH (DUF202 family)